MRFVRPTPSIRILLVASLASALAVSSCATKQFSANMEEEEKVCVVVENHHFNNVKIYAERDGVQHRLGTVEGMSTKDFHIPHRVLAGAWDFRLIADPIASTERVETHGLAMIPGCHTHWLLGQNLYASRVIVR